ncbi:MAG: hypothetical protein ABI771_15135 [Betaproteobacteria bacterium]
MNSNSCARKTIARNGCISHSKRLPVADRIERFISCNSVPVSGGGLFVDTRQSRFFEKLSAL